MRSLESIYWLGVKVLQQPDLVGEGYQQVQAESFTDLGLTRAIDAVAAFPIPPLIYYLYERRLARLRADRLGW